jgi:hypothetical protein
MPQIHAHYCISYPRIMIDFPRSIVDAMEADVRVGIKKAACTAEPDESAYASTGFVVRHQGRHAGLVNKVAHLNANDVTAWRR